MLLATESMYDRALERLGKFHQRRVCSRTSASTEQSYALEAVQKRRQHVDIRFSRPYNRSGRQQSPRFRQRSFRSRLERNITRNDNYRHAALADRRPNGVLEHEGHLHGIRNKLAVDTALTEEILRMRFLEVTATDLSGWDVGRYRQHGSAASLRVIKTIDKMKVSGPAGPRAHGEFSRQLSFTRRGEGGHLLVADVNPFDRLSGA